MQEETEAQRIGERIASRMDELKIEAAELAQELGVHQDTIYKLMRGETARRWINLVKLAKALRTSPNELLGFDSDMRFRLARLLVAAFEGLGATGIQSRNFAEVFLEVLDRPPDPRVHETEVLRIEVASAKRRSERP